MSFKPENALAKQKQRQKPIQDKQETSTTIETMDILPSNQLKKSYNLVVLDESLTET